MTTQAPSRTEIQAARIREAASFIGLNATSLAERTHNIDQRVTYDVINHIWSDKRKKNVDYYILEAVAAVTGQSADYLSGYAGERFDEPAAWEARGYAVLEDAKGVYVSSDSRTLFDYIDDDEEPAVAMDDDGRITVDLTALEDEVAA